MSREAFETLVGIPPDVKYNEDTDWYYWLGYPAGDCAINDLYYMYHDGKKSRQAEIDELRGELEKAHDKNTQIIEIVQDLHESATELSEKNMVFVLSAIGTEPDRNLTRDSIKDFVLLSHERGFRNALFEVRRALDKQSKRIQ